MSFSAYVYITSLHKKTYKQEYNNVGNNGTFRSHPHVVVHYAHYKNQAEVGDEHVLQPGGPLVEIVMPIEIIENALQSGLPRFQCHKKLIHLVESGIRRHAT